MKFEANKAVFLDALHMACNAVPNKTPLPILSNLLLRLKKNDLEMRATDLNMTIVMKLQVEGHEDGEILLLARKLLEVVRELPDFPVLLAADGEKVTIKSESGFQGNLSSGDASEYPPLPDLEKVASFEIPLKDIRYLADKTRFAAATDESRMALTGVCCEFKDAVLQMAATDGHRLGKAWTQVKGIPALPSIILPPKALSQILLLSEDPDLPIKVEIGSAYAHFSTDTVAIYTRLIEGPYPNYENVIPKEFSKKMKADREHLASVVRRVATMANSQNKLVVFNFQEKQLLLSARNQDFGGDSEESLPVEYQGDAVEVGINANYLLEVFRLVHTEEVRFKFNNPLGAFIVEPAEEKPGYFFIVMPLRILKEAD